MILLFFLDSPFTPVLALVLSAISALKRVFPAFLQPKPAECPKNFPEGQGGWPLYFAPMGFYNNRAFGTWFMFGLLLDIAARLIFPHFWVM